MLGASTRPSIRALAGSAQCATDGSPHSSARDRTILPSEALDALTAELRSVNQVLWDIEDEIRCCAREVDFGPKFIKLARSVYKNNDHRAALKRQINELLGSPIVEEKSFRGEP